MTPKYGKEITQETVSYGGTPSLDSFASLPKEQQISGRAADKLQRFTSAVNKVFPGGKVGESIGTLAGLAVTAGKEKLGLAPKGATKLYDTSAPSPLEVGADIASGAASIAGFKGVGTTGAFTSRLLKTIGLGATIGGAETLKEGGSIGDTVKSAATVGALSGAIPIVGAGLRTMGRQIELLPSRFVNSAFGRTKAQILADIGRDNVDDFSKYVVSSKPIGTANGLLRDSSTAITDLNSKILTQLSKSFRQSGTQSTIGIGNLLDDVTKLPEAEGALLKRVDVRSIIERLAPQSKKLLQKSSLTVTEANQLRQLIDRTLGDRAFLSTQMSTDKLILKSFANTLRETVKTKAPEGTRQLFSELSNEIRFREALLNKIAGKASNRVFSVGDILGGTLGATVGGIPGAGLGIAAGRIIESVPFKLTAAKTINAITKVAPVLEQLTPAQQTAILNLFSDLFSRTESRSPSTEQSPSQ